MIAHPEYATEPWRLRETGLDLNVLAQSESLFALSNGHIGWRGNLDEGEPHGLPGSYLNGVFEDRPLPYAEGGYGYPEAGQTVINVTNGKLIRLLVDDQPFDVRYGQVLTHERVLDFRTGLLHRQVGWVSPGGQGVRVRSTRLVSLVQRCVAAICYEVEPLDTAVRVVLQSELVANETLPPPGGDPREAAALSSPLVSEVHTCGGTGASLVHRTAASGLLLGAAMEHHLDAPPSVQVSSESFPDLGRLTITATLEPGQRLRLIKFVAYGWSAVRSQPAIADQVAAALTTAVQTGWDGLVDEHREYLADFWARADVEIEGDERIQQAVRFALFHVLQAGARAEGRAIAAKGLTGPGYDGHAFWDTEAFVLPVLTYTAPSAAADALRWRHSILPKAQNRATELGLEGAVFPWRTIAGNECSGYWPAGTAAFHIGADIADAVVRHISVTGDEAFERDIGVELLTQTARLWCSLGHHDAAGRFRIDGVTGPDEYSAVADNNIYTNLMAQHNLVSAAAAAQRHSDRATDLGVTAEEITRWLEAAKAMVVPYDEGLGVHSQSEGFTSHEIWDFEATTNECYPLLLHYPYFDLYRKQVVKQADLVLAMHLRGEAFTTAEKARNFAYYESLTVRDSSLSACTQAVLAAETGHLDLAYDYLTEAALMDLDNLEHNTRDGLHVASLAGTWIALVPGLAGLRERDGGVTFTPRLPAGITRLAATMCIRGSRLKVEITSPTTTYRVLEGPPLSLVHDGQPLTVPADSPVSVPNQKPPASPPAVTTSQSSAPASPRSSVNDKSLPRGPNLLAVTPLNDIGHWARGNGLLIVLFALGAILLARLVTWFNTRVTTQIEAHGTERDELVRTEAAKHRHALAQVVSWTLLGLIYTAAGILIVQRLGVPLAGFVASATVAGVAIGFGAQRVVQDLLAGFLVITERQYGFGDLIRISVIGVPSPVLGTVEDVSLRITTIRSVNGEVVITPNGQIVQVTNLSRDWARAVIDVPVPTSADVIGVSDLLRQVGIAAFADDEMRPLLLDPPTVMGVESIEVDQFQIRVVVRTLPGKQFDVGRMLRSRISQAFLRENINLPAAIGLPQSLDTLSPADTR